MTTKNLDSTESVVNFIVEEFQKMTDEKDISNILSKFDMLINKTLNVDDIIQLKKLIKFCFEKNSNPEEINLKFSEDNYSRLQNKIKVLQKKVENLENENYRMKFEMEKNSEEISSLKLLLNESQKEKKMLIDSKASLKSNLIKEKTDLFSEIAELKIKFSNLEQNNIHLEKKNDEICKKNNELEADMKDLKVKNLELEDVKKKNNELEADMKDLKVNNIELSKKNNELEADIRDLKVKNLELEDVKKKNNELEKDIKGLQVKNLEIEDVKKKIMCLN